MKTTSKISILGLVAALCGIALYIYAVYLMPSYAGYSGGGLSGLPAAFMIMAAISLIALGILVAAGSILVSLIKAGRVSSKD